MGGAANAAVTAVCYAETKEKWRERERLAKKRTEFVLTNKLIQKQ